jgi:hypothetical protein
MKHNCLIPGLVGLVLCLLAAQPARAAETRSTMTLLVNDKGSVEVIDRWEGLVQEGGTFSYFSAAKEIGTVPVKVRNHGFTLAFATRSYLRFEDGYYHFVTPDFYYAEGPLDVELSLTYPPNLVFVEANVEPSYDGEGVLHWSLADCVHAVVIAKFERVGPFVQPGQQGPEFQVDPSSLDQLTAEEIPRNADEVLKELENIIEVAGASEATDPDFLRVMNKLLAKFYYVLASNGLLLDYHLPDKEDEAEEPGPADEPQPPAASGDEGDGTLGTGAGSVGR